MVRLEDEGQLTTWQGRKGRVRTISSPSSEGGSREDGSKRLRQGSDTGVEEEVREDWALQVEKEKPRRRRGWWRS